MARVGLIGVGNMGGACARAWLSKKIVPAADLVLVERDGVKVGELTGTLGVAVDVNADRIASCDLVFLAFKPQDFAGSAAALRPHLRSGQVVISLLAGTTITQLQRELGSVQEVVRVMPNINSTIGRGVSVCFAGPGVTAEQQGAIVRLLNGVGTAFFVHDEALIDAATAVSASGPGYIFYIIEHMVGAAESLGFNRAEADKLVAETIAGSIAMWQESKLEPEELRAMVTSKGGTTAAAIEVFERGYLGKILKAGILRADERCRELARGVPPVK